MLRDSTKVRSDQKLATLGLLTGSVAHDFNNLLTAILGYTELLSEHLEDPKLLRYTSAVECAGFQASQMVQRLVKLSEPARGGEICEVNQVLSETECVLERVLGGEIDIMLALDPGVGAAVADPAELQQVVLNLAVNARDAMGGEGIVGIESRVESLSEGAARGLQLSPGSYSIVSVSDTGHGMDAETQARVFEAFFTTKGERGTGLGLATVKRIAERWGGAVAIESSLGQGTSVSIYLRTSEASTAGSGQVSQRSEPERRSHEGDETILVADDDPLVYSYVCDVLAGVGYRILGSTDPLEALEIAAKSGRRIDALVSDLEMPGLSGAELAERVQDLHPEACVVFASACTDPPRGIDLLAKPFDRHGLLSRVREALRSARITAA